MVSFAAPILAMPPPPTPLAKRPATTGIKRTGSYLDADDNDTVLTTTDIPTVAKRQRVRFDEHVEERMIEDWSDKSFDLVTEEVRTSIQRHLAPAPQQDDTQYAKLLQLLGQRPESSEAPSTKLLRKYMLAINSRIAVLGDCGNLVMAVLDLAWIGRDDEFVQVYERFLILLAGTHSKFTTPIMERLVLRFQKLPASAGRLPGEDILPRSEMFDRVHDTIQHILMRVPSASSALVRCIRHLFPNDVATARGHLQYQQHLLRLAAAVPELQTEIMSVIAQRLVNIDVQIQRDIEDLEDDAADQLVQRQQLSAEVEAEDDEYSDEEDDDISESEITSTEEERKLKELRLKVAKLDGTQDILFRHYAPAFTPTSRPEKNVAYQELLSHFTNFIMPNRSRHAQFLLFHFSQTSSSYSDVFINRCLIMMIDRNASPMLRLTACAYVASFVARGSHITQTQTRNVFTRLSQQLETLRHTYEPHCTGPDRKSYSIYYAIAQALLYIFCFRWRDLVSRRAGDDMSEEDILAEGRDLTWFAGVKETIHTNTFSPLNPLKVCSPEIVGEFAKIANHLRFIYAFSLLERNKRIRLGHATQMFKLGSQVDLGRRETAWDRKTGDSHHQLEAYFPFDPYRLPLSKSWVENEFNEWRLPRGMKQDDEEDGEDEEEEESDSDEEEEVYESDDESVVDDLTVEPTMSKGATQPISS